MWSSAITSVGVPICPTPHSCAVGHATQQTPSHPTPQLCAAKIIFEKRNGVSPFAPGQWKSFLAIYGGLWAAMNFGACVRAPSFFVCVFY